MSAPASDGLAAGLAVALEPVLGGPVEVADLRRLTGGASRETWSLTALFGGSAPPDPIDGRGAAAPPAVPVQGSGDSVELILRRDPPGRLGAPGAMRLEADAMRACHRAGLRVPEVLLDDDTGLLGTPGLIMRRVAGETLARRILRDDEYAPARRVLVEELGQFLAGLHAVDPAEMPGVRERAALDVWENYERLDARSAVFEKAFDWLRAHEPEPGPATVVHGDIRLGNLIVAPEGLRAVIDWETVHVADPVSDLAWLCLRAWRFGARPEVAGIGAIDDLVAAYESAGGHPVDRALLHWWLVQKTLTWGIGCMMQADVHLRGAVRSVELAVVGRRVAEQEWDLIELIAPDAWRAAAMSAEPPVVPDTEVPYGRPTARELLEAVREFLTIDVVSGADTRVGYNARVAVTTLEVVERELARPLPVAPGDDWPSLARSVRDVLAVNSPRHLTTTRAELSAV